MTVTLHNTHKIVFLNGVPCRVWEGKTAAGVECHAFIVRIAVAHDADSSQFDKELMECAPPSVDVAYYPLKLII